MDARRDDRIAVDGTVAQRLWASGTSRWRIRLSPINQRRWDNFKANRRGYWSLWIFLGLFVFSLFAEFIANDKPIIAVYKGEVLVPVLVDYPVVFATLYIFALLGLVVNLVSDFIYTLVDPRIDFESREV